VRRIANKTRKPIRVPLPGGKVLHLGPGAEGTVSFAAIDHAGLRALVEAGAVEVLDDQGTSANGGVGPARRRAAAAESHAGRGGRRSGDR
jgi:hypothetical protein